ncbi:hypothetical protein AKJ18_13530 [Vibrio xuii]|nr:hypothetical protein AKJ18_13530 [Vibrio xuii]
MQIRWSKSQVGKVLNEQGVDYKGKPIDIPSLLKNGEHWYERFRGFIDSNECDSFQRVKLIGFTAFSVDEGHTWTTFDKDMYLIGVRKWNEFYVVLFDGLPRAIPYTPKDPVKYYNNVVGLREYREAHCILS